MALYRKIALIDLDRSHIDTFPISVDDRNRFLGGGGIATYLLCRYAPKKVHSLSAESFCVISAGLLGGTLSAPQGYTILTTKSGSTGLMIRTCLKGPFATEMRQAGFDHLVFKGRAKRQTYLFVHDGRIELIKAPNFAGKRPIERRTMLRDATAGGETRLLYIKKESKDRFFLADDSFSPDVESENSGVGAALAAKNIEAVACRGTLDIEVKDPEAIIAYEKNYLARNVDKETPCSDPEGSAISGPAGKVELIEIKQTIEQCLGLPFLINGGSAASDMEDLSTRIRLNTGMVLDKNDLKNIAYRCITIERLYNIREGIAEKGGRTAEKYRKYGWTRKAVVKKRKVFDVLRIGDLWAQLKA
jgi:aldehyde:ferredoxin oxidoreductase